jgi:hypothetical protein
LKEVSDKNFGLVIAYVLPGFVGLWGASWWSDTVAAWLNADRFGAASVGAFLYAILGSLGAGLTVSAVRWVVIDTLHHRTGIHPPNWDFSRLQDKLQAFDALVENHYRYYQFYANTFVAVVFACGCWAIADAENPPWPTWRALAISLLEIVLYATSRDTLRKYYSRAERLLGPPVPKKGANAMSNGYHPPKQVASKKTSSKSAERKPAAIRRKPGAR